MCLGRPTRRKHLPPVACQGLARDQFVAIVADSVKSGCRRVSRVRQEEAEEQVLDYIEGHRDEIVSFLAEYIQRPSVNPDLGEASDVIGCQKWLSAELGAKARPDINDLWIEEHRYANLALVFKGTSHGRPIMLAGHTDTVPVTREQERAWRVDAGPFSGAVRDGKVWGRGAADMKAGNVAAAMAVASLRRSGIRLGGDVILTFVSSEESGNRRVGIDSIIERGYKAPTCLVMEPSDLAVIPAINGEFYFRLKVTGKSGHIATRHKAIYPTPSGVDLPAVNAIDKTFRYLQALWDAEREWGLHHKHPLMDPGAMTVNISKIRGGETFSALAETCEVVGSVLYSPSLTRDEAMAEFRAVIERATASDYWLRANPPDIELPYFLPDKPSVNLTPEHDLCASLARAFERVRGSPPRFAASISTSDGNYISEYGVDVITYGPGSFEMGTHGVNEYIPVEDLIACTKVYAVALLDWCGLG